jgi:hypothetical protein
MIEPNITTSFRNTISQCDLQDLGYKGNRFTWTNRQEGEQLIQSRLDRFFANSGWISLFPTYTNTHLTRYQSDHCPISLEFTNKTSNQGHNQHHYGKKFEQIWLTNENHLNIVKDAWQSRHSDIGNKLQFTLNSLHNWGKQTFGSLPKRIKETQNDLATLQNHPQTNCLIQQIKDKEKELDDLLEKEEIWWCQRSRAMWLTHGDKNTSFFHQKASHRKRRNRIDSIKDPMGQYHTDQREIEQTFITHFQHLFTSQATNQVMETVQVVKNRINPYMFDHLNKDYTKQEVLEAVKGMKSLAAPGPDGLPAKFYQTYWEIVGKDITNTALNILNKDGNPGPFNATHICLIPKTKNPSQPSDFRPISLCNVTLKIITKAIANRLKPILPEIISTNQSAFVPGRLITDNVIIANEIFHYLSQTNSATGFVGIKTDMAKAYDRIEWNFLQATLSSMNFPIRMVNTIMKCVTTVNFSILINGKPSPHFYPQRGLRQGDPLSPYLFILCADVLSALITNAHLKKTIHGVKIAPKAPEITHLFFADDSVIFCRATEAETTSIKDILSTYQAASGQLVNYSKSEIIFSKRVPRISKTAIQQILHMPTVHHFAKYLGQPTYIGRSKKQTFNYIQDKVWAKLKGWKEKSLSFAGRSTLIKAVAQAIPTYLMSAYSIPKGICRQMEGMISRFWWGCNVDQKKIHWTS